MVRRYLPPLNGLRAFEAVGRHLSVTRAAVELCVTESAVSQQIKRLEQHLGHPLLRRHPAGLELTSHGKMLLPLLSESLDKISEASLTIQGDSKRRVLRIQLTPHLSANWISKRLSKFLNAFPNIEVSIRHSYDAIDPARPDVDVALGWDLSVWKGVAAEPLIHLGYLPMCSPDLFAGKAVSVESISDHPLLQETGTRLWADWFASAGITRPRFPRLIEYDNYDIVVHAAVQGQGMAILMYPMFLDHFDKGRLIAPFGIKTSVPITCFLFYAEASLARDEVRLFRNWISAEVAADACLSASFER